MGLGTSAMAQVADVGGSVSSASALASPRLTTFEITGFEVVDEGRLAPAALGALKATLAGYAGPKRSIQDVTGARRAAQAQLDTSRPGEFIAVLPEQTMTAGKVRLVVVKATQRTLDNVTTKSATDFDEKNVLRSLPALKKGQPIDLSVLATDLTLANTSPMKRTRVTLTPKGDTQVDAAITAEAPSGSMAEYIAVDNFGPVGARGRLTAGLVNANLSGSDDVLSLSAIIAQDPDRQAAISASYTLPLYPVHAIVELAGIYSKANAGNVSGFNINGGGTIAKAKWTQLLPSLFGNDDTRISADYQYHHSENRVLINGFEGLGSLVPSASTAPFSLGIESALKITPDWSTNLGLRLARNIAGALGSSSKADISSLRDGAGSYTLLSGILGVKGQVSDWQLSSSLQGQWTKDALIPIDQVNITGPFAVRGFVNAAILGDKAAISRSEVSTPSTVFQGFGLRGYGFYDWGKISRNHALPGELTDATVSSTGLGLRTEAFEKVSIDVYWARKLSGKVFDTDNGANSLWATAVMKF